MFEVDAEVLSAWEPDFHALIQAYQDEIAQRDAHLTEWQQTVCGHLDRLGALHDADVVQWQQTHARDESDIKRLKDSFEDMSSMLFFLLSFILH
jgi:hypothetical protein